MSYQALARTLRPKDFTSVVGQEHVVKALQNSIKTNSLHHAYLFTGTRGVGKTTIARIFAKCLNCETGLTANPCGSCNACVSIDNNCFADLIEIDAASKTKVEDTRDLLDSVMYAPVLGRYKVYIIDEVHMLSTHSFNAFLKTLEEPPEHVKFILATTDPKKLPVTVLSRCLQFNLRHASQKNLNDLLQKILEDKNLEYDNTAVSIIAKHANGSIRDLLSITEQVIALVDDNKLSIDNVETMLGSVSSLEILQILDLIAINNTQDVFDKLNKLLINNIDFSLFLEQFLEVLHNLSVIKHIYQVNPKEFSKYQKAFFDYIDQDSLVNILDKLSQDNLQFYYQVTQLAYKDLEFMPDAFMVVQMAVLRMLAFHADFILDTKPNSNEEKNTVINNYETSKPEITKPEITKPEIIKPEIIKQEISEPEISKPSLSNQEELVTNYNTENLSNFDWELLASKLNVNGIEKQLVEHLEFISFEKELLTLNLSKNMSFLLTDSRLKELERKIFNSLNNKIKLKVSVNEESKSHSIAAKKSLLQQKKQQEAIENIKQNPHVNELVNVFDAKVDLNSLELIEETES